MTEETKETKLKIGDYDEKVVRYFCRIWAVTCLNIAGKITKSSLPQEYWFARNQIDPELEPKITPHIQNLLKPLLGKELYENIKKNGHTIQEKLELIELRIRTLAIARMDCAIEEIDEYLREKSIPINIKSILDSISISNCKPLVRSEFDPDIPNPNSAWNKKILGLSFLFLAGSFTSGILGKDESIILILTSIALAIAALTLVYCARPQMENTTSFRL